MPELLFIRHGQTEWNVAHRLQGRGDSPLTALGETQAQAHLEWLRTLPPDRILASPLGRVRATVGFLLSELALEVTFDDRLQERCMGDYEGLTMNDIEQISPGQMAAREEAPWAWRPAGGENYDDMMARTAPLVQELRAGPAKRTLVASHGTVVRPVLGQLLGLDAHTMVRIQSPNDVAYRLILPDEGLPAVFHWRAGNWTEGLLLG